MRVYVIAEAGVNHNGDVGMAHRLVDAAAAAGADAVKFQTFHAEAIVSASAPKAPYQSRTTEASESQLEMVRRLELDEAAHRELMAHCAAADVDFLSSPFDAGAIRLLAELGLSTIKVPSGEITNLPYLRQLAGLGVHLLLSTGMSTMDDVRAALDALEAAGAPRERVTLLHCTSEYPAPYDEVNLRAMVSLRVEFGVEVGYSDHTVGNEVAIAAVALGATVIEKHFTLDRTLPGPDHAASTEPAEFAKLVRAVRHIEVALGDGRKVSTPSERSTMAVARKSIVAVRDIAAGEVFSEEDLAAKRPGTGITPMLWDRVLGRTAHRAYAAGELIDEREAE